VQALFHTSCDEDANDLYPYDAGFSYFYYQLRAFTLFFHFKIRTLSVLVGNGDAGNYGGFDPHR
jgi:hypothetical protein